MRNFTDRIVEATKAKGSILCLGLDPQPEYMPPHLIHKYGLRKHIGDQVIADMFIEFNKTVLDEVHESIVAVKPNLAFYLRYRSPGIFAFEQTLEYARTKYGLVIIGDSKCGDGGDTAQAYASAFIGTVPQFGNFDGNPITWKQGLSGIAVDATTINPLIGDACAQPFLQDCALNGTGIFPIVRTSFNPKSAFEELRLAEGGFMWQAIARQVSQWSNSAAKGDNGFTGVGAVVGATRDEDALWIRKQLPNSYFLVPGYGAQGGGAKSAILGVTKEGFGAVVNSSRGITYAYKKGAFACASEDYAKAAGASARFSRDELKAELKTAGIETYCTN